MLRLLPLVLLLFLVGCSAQKRAQNHLQRAVRLDPTIITTDTVYTDTILVDTVYTDSVRIDTAFITSPIDTFTYLDTLTNTTVRVERRHDTIRLTVHSPPDTLIRTDTVRITTSINTGFDNACDCLIGKPNWWPRTTFQWIMFLIVFGIAILLYVLVRMATKR